MTPHHDDLANAELCLAVDAACLFAEVNKITGINVRRGGAF